MQKIMNSFFDNYFLKREEREYRSYELEEDVYQFLKKNSEYYNATMSDLINVCIGELIRTKELKVKVYESNQLGMNPSTNLYIDKSKTVILKQLKESSGISLKRLVNASVRNIMEKQ